MPGFLRRAITKGKGAASTTNLKKRTRKLDLGAAKKRLALLQGIRSEQELAAIARKRGAWLTKEAEEK